MYHRPVAIYWEKGNSQQACRCRFWLTRGLLAWEHQDKVLRVHINIADISGCLLMMQRHESPSSHGDHTSVLVCSAIGMIRDPDLGNRWLCCMWSEIIADTVLPPDAVQALSGFCCLGAICKGQF